MNASLPPLHPRLRTLLEHCGIRDAQAAIPAPTWRQLVEATSRQFDVYDEERRSLDQSLETLYREVARLGANLEHNTAVRLTAERNLLRTVVHSIADGVFVLDRDGCERLSNSAAETMLGWPVGELRGKPLLERILAAGTHAPDYARLLEAGQPWRDDDAHFLRRDGSQSAVSYTLNPIAGEQGPTGAVLVFRDVSRQREIARRLSHRASHDPLTGLVNRAEFEERLARLIEGPLPPVARDAEHVLLYLDLDRFKTVNDICGHAAGDALLRQVARLLGQQLRTSDTLARLGGDEFAVLLENCPAEQGTRIADKLLAAIRSFRFDWLGKHFEIGVSIGVVPLRGEWPEIGAAIAAADRACYRAKNSGRDRWCLLDPQTVDERDLAQERPNWAQRLREALSLGQLGLYAQTVRALDGTEPDSFELFLRLLDPHEGEVPPGAFLAAAERLDLATTLDRWVIDTALAHIAGLPDDGSRFSVNLSAASLRSGSMATFIAERLHHYAVSGTRLCIEITATDALCHWDRASDLFNALRELGCRCALDDVGNGLPALGQLEAMALDYLKIDGDLVRGMLVSRTDAAMVEAVTRIGHALGLRLVAETVETEAALEHIRRLGVDYAQGWAISTLQRWA